MFNEMPPLVSPPSDQGYMEYDLVTGAPRIARPKMLAYPSGYVPAPAFLPPHGYKYPGYIPGTYLVPSPQPAPVSLPPSPSLSPTVMQVPAGWMNAYREYYGNQSPYQAPGMALYPAEASPAQKQVPLLASPQVSPYANLIPLPALAEENYEDTQQTWASRLMSWIQGQAINDPHRQFVQDVLIHECLDRKRSAIRWNISYPPHTISVNEAPDPHASAFSPELASCRIVSPLLPWAIEVKAHAPYPYITVLSLLGDIYKALNKGIERNVYNSVPEGFRQQVNQAFNDRIFAIPDEAASSAAYNKGIKRVDFLLDKRMYVGLTQIKTLMYTFELKVSSKA